MAEALTRPSRLDPDLDLTQGINRPRAIDPKKDRVIPKEEGISTDWEGKDVGLQYDPVQTLAVGASGAGLGFAVGGPPGALAGAALGVGGDIGLQIAQNLSKGLPWYLGLASDIAGAIVGSAAGRKALTTAQSMFKRSPRSWDVDPVYRGPESTPPLGTHTSETKPKSFDPRDFYSPKTGVGSSVEGTWPNITQRLKDRTLGPAKEEAVVTGQWPNVLSRTQTGPTPPALSSWSPWRRVLDQQKTTLDDAARAVGETTEKATSVAEQVLQATKHTSPTGPSIWGDIKNYAPGIREAFGNWYTPILTAIERAAGQKIGSQLTALEGQKTAKAAQVWQEVFGDLVKTLEKLPEQHYDNFVDVIEKKVAPASKQVVHAVTEFNKVFGPEEGLAILAQRKAGIEIEPLLNYFPHEFDAAFIRGLINNPERQSPIIDKLVKDGVALNVNDAKQMLRDFMSRTSRTVYRDRPAGSEFDRAKNLTGYLRDPLKAVSQRGRHIANRIAELEIYGPKKQRVRELISLFDQSDQRDRVMELFRLTMGRDPVDEGIQKVLSKVMSFQASTSLSLSGFLNLSQPSMLALRTSIPNMAGAIFHSAFHPRQVIAAARQLGIYADLAQREVMLELAGGLGGKFTSTSLKFFTFTERVVRAIAAHAGEDWAKTIQTRLQSVTNPKELAALQRELTRLNFTESEVQRLLSTKVLTPNDVKLIQWSIADQTSFLPRPGRKSEFYLTNPLGPLILQFKGFVMNTGRLLKQTIMDEWRAGNKQPALRAATVVFPTLAVMGEIPADLSALARGSDRPATDLTNPKDLFVRAIDNITQIGALGLGLGLLTEMTGIRGARGYDVLGTLFGPTAQAVETEGRHPAGLLFDTNDRGRHAYELARRVVRRIPYAGPPLVGYTMPSSNQDQSKATFGLWDKLGFTRKAVGVQRMKEVEDQLRSLQR